MNFNFFQRMVTTEPERYPARMGMPWSLSETNTLLTDLKMGKSIEKIADEHKRTVGGINARRKKFVEELYKKGKNVNQIKEVTRHSAVEVEYLIDRIKEKEDNENKLQNLQDSFPSFGKKELEIVSEKVAEILKNDIILKLTKRVEELEKMLSDKSQTSSNTLNDTIMYDVWDSDNDE